MRREYLHNSRSVLLTWAVSYVLMILFPIIINLIVYTRTDYIVRNETIESNHTLLTQIQRSVDNRLLEIKKLGIEVSFNPRVLELAGIRKRFTNHNLDTLSRLGYEFVLINVSNSYIDDFFVYFVNNQIILRNGAITYARFLYNDLYNNDRVAFDNWITQLNSRNSVGFTMIPITDTSKEIIKQQIVYMHPVSSNKNSNPSGMIVITIGQDKLLSSLKDIKLPNDGSIFIVDNYGNVIASNGTTVNAGLFLTESPVKN